MENTRRSIRWWRADVRSALLFVFVRASRTLPGRSLCSGGKLQYNLFLKSSAAKGKLSSPHSERSRAENASRRSFFFTGQQWCSCSVRVVHTWYIGDNSQCMMHSRQLVMLFMTSCPCSIATRRWTSSSTFLLWVRCEDFCATASPSQIFTRYRLAAPAAVCKQTRRHARISTRPPAHELDISRVFHLSTRWIHTVDYKNMDILRIILSSPGN